MNNVVRFCVLEAAAQLPSDVEKIPDGKSLFASQHGCDAIALDVVHASTELAVDLTRAKYIGDIRIAQSLGVLCLRQQRLFERRRVLSECAQLNGLQGNRLPAFRVVSFV